MNIKFGWHHFRFELHNIELSTSIAIEEDRDGGGDWIERDSPHSLFVEPEEADKIFKKWETNPNVRFGSPSRVLSATAKFREYSYGAIRVGIPEDKDSWDFKGSKIINGIDLIIRDGVSEAEWKLMKWRGVLGHIKSDAESDIEESTYLDLRVNSAFFDTIEKKINQGATKLGIAVQIKCWHWIDPEGSSTLFVDEEEDGLAELSNFAADKSIRDEFVELESDDPNYDGELVETSNVAVHILKRLGSLETHLTNIRNILVVVLVMMFIIGYRLVN